MTDALGMARAAAAQHLFNGGYHAEASQVAAGRGDDYAEVRIALSLVAILKTPPAIAVSPLRRRLAGEEC